MFDENKLYSLDEYLFDIENYATFNIECDIILPIFIWSDIFKELKRGICPMFSGSSMAIYMDDSSVSGHKVIHFLTRDDSGHNYSSQGFILTVKITNLIKVFERNVKIDKLLE